MTIQPSDETLIPDLSLEGGRPQQKPIDWTRIFGLRNAGIYYALILLFVVLTIATALTGRPNYVSMTNLTNILYQASLISILAVAMTVVLFRATIVV